MSKKINIAIDGPSGSGKGVTSRLLSEKLNYTYVDSGSMYRAVAYELNKNNISIDKVDESSFENIKLSFNEKNHICINGVDVENEIRTPQGGKLASDYAVIPVLRNFVDKAQKEIAKEKGCIIDGRDAGTTVIPNAELKIYLDASVEVRAKRRLKDFQGKGIGGVTFEDVKKQIEERDHQDMNREVSPLTKAKDAIEIDTSNLTILEQVEKIYELAINIIK